jgi:uncharacterized protein (TIGR03067 family)
MYAVLMFTCLAIAVPDRQDPTPKQADPLPQQIFGEWKLVKHVIAGNDIGSLNDLVMVFDRDKMQHVHVRADRRDAGGTFPYTLDANRNPAVIDFRAARYIGIIKLDGDLLTICFAEVGTTVPPTEFVSRSDNRTTLLQATRMRK